MVATHYDPALKAPLELILPAGARGPAFLVSGNFRALRKYNQSTSYALAVGHLADRIAGGAALAAAWPVDDTPLNRAERAELQSLLTSWGLDTGGLDGIIGDRTRAAIRATQRTLRLAEDGHPSVELLHRLRGNGGP
jgi:membrane-bound lytic murein transglycosylase B